MKPERKPSPRKWAWHHGVLLSLRNQLLTQRTQRLAESSEPLEPHSMDIADSATDEFEHNFALSRLSAEQDELYEVEEALKRIENGTYGRCEETGKRIPDARLRAIPWARFGREVAASLEAKGAINRMHLGSLGSVRGPAGGNLAGIQSNAETKADPSRRSQIINGFLRR